MVSLQRIRCTKCGAEFEEYTGDALILRCTRVGCGATFVVRQEKEIAGKEIDQTMDILDSSRLLPGSDESEDVKMLSKEPAANDGCGRNTMEGNSMKKDCETASAGMGTEQETGLQDGLVARAAPFTDIKKIKSTIPWLTGFKMRLGRLLSSLLIFTWLLLLVINFLGLFGVLNSWQRELPVLKSVYVASEDIYKEYFVTFDFNKDTNQLEFLTLSGVLLILVVSMPFGPRMIITVARRLIFWLVVLFPFSIYYYLAENKLVQHAILQDKIIMITGFLLHAIIALAVCLIAKTVFRKAVSRQTTKINLPG